MDAYADKHSFLISTADLWKAVSLQACFTYFIVFKVPITSNFLLSHLILHNTKLVFSKKNFDLNKTQFFLKIFLRRSNLPPFWYTIRTSPPRFTLSRDVGSGRRDLSHDLADFAPCKVIQESLGFRIPRCGFRIPCLWIPDSTSTDSGFHNQQPGFWITIMVGFRIPFAGFRIPLAGFRIPKPWIPDSTDQNYLDSGFRITLPEATDL